MNAEQLLECYERVADAPDAVARLRRLVLDLAICGKLIEADRKRWADRPIESCLAALPDGKRIHQGWSPQCEQHPSPSDEEWGVLRTTAIQDGYFVEAENKKLPDALTPKPRLEVQSDDILITCAGPRARCGISCRVLNVRRRLLISGKMYRFRANTDLVAPGYLSLFLRADETRARIDAMKTGSSESGLNLTQERFRLLTVRFGPIQEQHRIVAKVDELMALCDRLEAARSQREATRTRLTAATLARLNTPEPPASPDGDASKESPFQSDARFALKVLPALTDRPDQIKQLRQTILNLAVRGLLTHAASTDVPAQTLRRKLADEAPSKRTSSSKLSDSRPFQIPDNWEWAALGELIVDGPQNGLSPKPTTRHDAPKAITLTATTSGVFDPAHFKHVEATLPDDSDFWLRDGDLLFQRGNTREYVGIAAVYTGPPRAFLFPDLMIRVRVSARLNLRYIHLAAIAPPARRYFSESASGAQLTMPKINQTVLLALPVPLPPLAEQHRIVSKVDELMSLCDQLEASLTRGQNTRSRLLNALLHEALAPAESEPEAA